MPAQSHFCFFVLFSGKKRRNVLFLEKMEISCCGHCTTTVQEEKQVEEEEEVGKGRDSLQSLEESIRPL